jgi:hypothetical protein
MFFALLPELISIFLVHEVLSLLLYFCKDTRVVMVIILN